MQPFRVCTFVPAAALVLVLGACSGRGGDAAAATSKPRNPATSITSTGAGESAVANAEGTATAAGEMQALLSKLPPPARSATEAVAQFHWNGEDAQPAGALQSGLDALNAVKARSAAREQELMEQEQSATGAILDAGLSDPAGAGAIDKKLATMSREQQIAYVMRLNDQRAQQLQAQMQVDGDSGAAVAEAQEDAQHVLETMGALDAQIAARQQQSDAEKAHIEKQAAAGHQAVDDRLQHAMARIPYEREGEGGGGCFNQANAQRARALLLRAADQHVAVADEELKQAARWAGDARASMQQEARAIDAAVARLSGDVARVPSGALHRQLVAERESIRGDGRQFRPFWEAVRDFDLAAAQQVHRRDQQNAGSWKDQLCR